MTDDKKSKRLIDLTMQLLEMSEDHEKRILLLEQRTTQIPEQPPIIVQPQFTEVPRMPYAPGPITPIAEPVVPIKPEKGFKNPFKSKNGKPWYTSAGSWIAIFAFIILCYMVYLFLKSQHFVIPRFHL
jgi:hypothetical protein